MRVPIYLFAGVDVLKLYVHDNAFSESASISVNQKAENELGIFF